MERIHYEGIYSEEIHFKVRIYKVNPIIPYFNVKKIKKNELSGKVRFYKNEEIYMDSIRGQENAFFLDTGIELVATPIFRMFDIVGVNETCDLYVASIGEVRFMGEQVAKVFWTNERFYATIEKILTDEEIEKFYWTLTAEKIYEQTKLLESFAQETTRYWNPIPKDERRKRYVKMIEQMRKQNGNN